MSDAPETPDASEASEPSQATESKEGAAAESEAPAAAAEAAPTGDPLKAPGLWPGMSEMILFAAMVINGSIWATALLNASGKKQFQTALFINLLATVILTLIWHRSFKKRHAKREGRPGNNGFFRIRDLVMFTTIGLAAPMVGLFVAFKTSYRMRQAANSMPVDPAAMAAITLVMCLFGIAITSKVWGRLAGSKSILWALVFLFASFSTVGGGLALIKMAADANLVGGLLFGAAETLLGVCFLLGGLALFKAPEGRGSLARKVALLLAISWLGICAGEVLFGFEALGAGSQARKEMQVQVAGFFFPGFLLFLLSGLAMLKHRKTLS